MTIKKDSPKKESRGREVWKSLTFSGRLRYLWDYYKLHFVIAAVLLYMAGFTIHGHFTKKEPLLYGAMVNVALSRQLEEQLVDRYLDECSINPAKNPFMLYRNLYLTDDPSSEVFEYVHASQMKILGTINAAEMDFAVLDQEAFDAFAQNGFLYDLDKLLDENAADHPDLKKKLSDHLVTNMEIKEDNAKEIALNPSVEYHSVTAEYKMGIDLSSCPVFRDSGFTDPVYLGVISNTPRPGAVLDYLEYLYRDV